MANETVRLAALADVHCNRNSQGLLGPIFARLADQADVLLLCGDLVDYGPEPGPCIDWVRANAAYCVRGNHDHGVAQDVPIQGVAGFRFLTSVTRPLAVAVLTPEQRAKLEAQLKEAEAKTRAAQSRVRGGGARPSGGGSKPCNCPPGDPLCSCL